MKKKFLLFLSIVLALGSASQAQQGCTNSACAIDTLNVSTGYNPNTNSLLTPLAIDANWVLTAVPTNAAVSLPGPTWVITPSLSWSTYTNAQWLSPITNAGYNINNIPADSFGPFRFQRCFCLCQPSSVRIKYKMLADDQAQGFIDNILLVDGTTGGHFLTVTQLLVDTTITLAAGVHCLSVDLYNTGGGPMGFSLEGYVTGTGLIKTSCCTTNGRICGVKLRDENCDGNVNASLDQGVGGWIIYLKDGNGNIIDTAYTDGAGNYCFDNLPAGTYTVEEGGLAGWTQTSPASPGTHTINVVNNEGFVASFGNCMDQSNDCGYTISMDLKVEECRLKASPMIMSIPPPGYNLVSTLWNFGDGTSSTEYSPTHYYTSTGTYTVCLTITTSNDQECCTDQICVDIHIAKLCDKGCFFIKDYYFSPGESCYYNYQAQIQYAGYPVSTVYWDFGDGSTSSDLNGTHVFPQPGTYNVCLHVFAAGPAGVCCHQSFCNSVVVNCSPCPPDDPDGTKTGLIPEEKTPAGTQKQSGAAAAKPAVKTDMIVLDQNAPNPFAESTIINYQIPRQFNNAYVVFKTASGQVLKSYKITRHGEGRLQVFADDLSSGIYSYTLVVDGRIIDTKNMVKH